MDDRLTYRPTLVVGLGGTGCEIAEGVYREARTNGLDQRGRIAVMGFDTDVNDIQKRTGIDARHIVQTSSLDTIYQILEKNPEAETTFCLGRGELPNRLLNMKLIEGAAQIRMLSHLALYDQLKRRATEIEGTIGTIIAALARHDGRTEFQGALNIIVCGSLAGATGSGMAVQTALLLRRIAHDRGVAGAQVRGVFLLPDVFVRAASLGSQQIDNVLANGYASLKELNAVIARAEQMESARGFEYDFAPGRRLENSEAPFEAVTFIDYENLNGGNLGVNLANYKRLAIRAVYLQTFSEVGKETLSRTINDALVGVEAAARKASSIFSAIGIAAVRYPAELMADYLAQRFAKDLLVGDWLRLDREFRDEMRRFEERRAAGNFSQKAPDIAETYLESLDRFARRERLAFFVEITDRLNPTVVDPETREESKRPLHRQFLDAFLAHVSETFWSSARFAEIRGRGAIDPSTFRMRDRVEAVVRQSENLLDADFMAVETAVSEQPDRIFNNMITVDDDRGVGELQPHSIQYHTVRGGPHPVQVRAFLYEVIRAARAMRDAIDVDQLRRNARATGDVFLDDKIPDERESGRRGNLAVLERARDASRPGMIGRMVGSTAKFVAEYVTYYDETVERIRAYADGGLRHRVLGALLAEIEPLVATYEGLFAEIGRSLAAIEEDVRRLEQRHAGSESFDGNVYIYADVFSKSAAWEELRERTIAQRQTDGVNTAINAAIYRKHRADRKARRSTNFAGLRELFDSEVVDKFAREAVKRDHRSVWDMSIIDAVKREAEIEARRRQAEIEARKRGGEIDVRPREGESTENEWKDRLKRAVDLVKAQAEPFVRLQDPSNGQIMVFWAMPEALRQEYGNGDEFDRLFTFQQGERPLLAPEFSGRELMCVSSRVNLELTHFAKLDPGTDRGNANEPTRGRYQRAYADRISKLIDEEMSIRGVGAATRTTSVLTPHIHREWHRASRLPEIFPEAQRRIRLDCQRATLVALGIGLLQKETDYGRSVTYFSTVGRLAALSIRERLIDSHDIWQVYKTFRDRADLIRATHGVWAAEKAALQPAARFDENIAVVAVAGPGAVLRILELAAPRDAEKTLREAEALGLFEGREILLDELAAVLLPHLDAEGRANIVRGYGDKTAAEAFEHFRALEGIQKPTLEQLLAVFDAGKKSGRGQLDD